MENPRTRTSPDGFERAGPLESRSTETGGGGRKGMKTRLLSGGCWDHSLRGRQLKTPGTQTSHGNARYQGSPYTFRKVYLEGDESLSAKITKADRMETVGIASTVKKPVEAEGLGRPAEEETAKQACFPSHADDRPKRRNQ